MPTVIDQLVITLGLDPSNFTKGQKEALAAFKATQDEATRAAKEIESRGKQAAEFFSQIKTQVVGLLAAFTAGYGIKEFFDHTVSTDAAVGRLSKNVGVAVGELTAWEGIARRSGAATADVDSSLTNLTQQFQQFALTGQSSAIPYFRALGIQVSDANGNLRPMNDLLLDLADRFQGMDPAKAQAFGAGLGITPGMVNTLMQGRAALIAMRAEVDRIGHANAADTAASQQLQQAWRALTDASEDLGRKLITAVAPALLMVSKLLSQVFEWAAQHPRVVQAFTAIIGVVTGLGIALAVVSAPIILFTLFTAGIAAAAAAVALLYDDWKTFTEGGKSLFEGFWRVVSDGWNLLKALFTGSADDIRKAWTGLFKDLGELFIGWVRGIYNLKDAVKDAVAAAFGSAFEWIEDRWKTIKELFHIGGGAAPTSAPGGARPAAPSSGGSDVDKLVTLGWTREQAIGIAANLFAESRGNPHGPPGDNGQAYGLAQWHPDRQAAFKQWSGHDIRQSTRDEQLGFVDYELRQGNERAAGAALRNTRTAAEAAEVVSRRYERPADVNGEAARRAQIALALQGGASLDGATGVPAAARYAGSGNVRNSTSSAEVNINTINVNAPNATDANGISRDIAGAMRQNSYLASLNSGLQ